MDRGPEGIAPDFGRRWWLSAVGRTMLRYAFALLLIRILAAALPGSYADYLRFHGATVIDPRVVDTRPILARLAMPAGDRSFATGERVGRILAAVLPATCELALAALLTTLVLAAVFALITSTSERTRKLMTGVATTFVAVPSFVTAGLLVVVMASLALPIGGRHAVSTVYEPLTGFFLVDQLMTGNWSMLWEGVQRTGPPAFVIALAPALLIGMVGMEDAAAVARADYIRTLIAIGVPRRRLMAVYVLRIVLGRLSTLLGVVFSSIFTGSIVVELAFDYPGVGAALARATLQRDSPLLLALVVSTGTIYFVFYALADLMQQYADPRLRNV